MVWSLNSSKGLGIPKASTMLVESPHSSVAPCTLTPSIQHAVDSKGLGFRVENLGLRV